MLQIKTFDEPLFPIFADILAQISDPATNDQQQQSIEVPEKVRSLYALNASRKQMLQHIPLITLSIEELGYLECLSCRRDGAEVDYFGGN